MIRTYRYLLALAGALASPAARPAAAGTKAGDGIEQLVPPPAAAPPEIDADRQTQLDLQRKRSRRQRREARDQPAPIPYQEKLHAALLQEAQTPHPRTLLLELAWLIPTPATTLPRQGYTADPTVHFLTAWHLGSSSSTTTGVWVGARLAPFAGSGVYRGHPGTYGLTYFGPMLGVGKLDPPPSQLGRRQDSPISAAEVEIPSVNGWLLSGGIAAVSKTGHSEWPQDKDSDFAEQALTFEAPGLWLEARYLHVMYGAFGGNLLAGVQAGRGKTFLYAGYGFAAWN